ncbi:hypothetical protein CRM22_006233, partial [Opisthorchis felineus]
LNQIMILFTCTTDRRAVKTCWTGGLEHAYRRHEFRRATTLQSKCIQIVRWNFEVFTQPTTL